MLAEQLLEHPPAPARSAGSAPAQPALDLHEGIGTTGCPRWPANMRLLSSQGELVEGRCKGPNLCAYCARLAAVENAEVLALDAMHGTPPSTWMVLTSASTVLNPAAFKVTRMQLIRSLRKRYPGLEFAWLWELTTGYGDRSGGKRRLHGNVMLKGCDFDHGVLREHIELHWCRREKASLQAQHVGSIDNAGGLMRYLALHFQKESQAPPIGWKGHRFQTSRGYLWEPTPKARELARHSLRLKREIWRAEDRGETPHDAQLSAHEAMQLSAATTWRMAYVNPATCKPMSRPSNCRVSIPRDQALRLIERQRRRELVGASS